ncbi:hypothetical protein QQ045_011482 [Rhodiola kirilowii]
MALWTNNIAVNEQSHSHQHITVEVNIVREHINILCSFVYASVDNTIRQQLWDELSEVATQSDDLPWLIGGDFNTILFLSEKMGRRKKRGKDIRDFSEFLTKAGVSDVGFTGNRFTWPNNQEGANQVWERLDRCLANGVSLVVFPNLELKRLHGTLRRWNWETFGDVNRKVKELSNKVDLMEKIKVDLEDFLRFQFSILEEKTKYRWLEEGDRNTNFFHASLKARRLQNRFNLKLEDDTETEDAEIIGNKAAEYFKTLSGSFSDGQHIPRPNLISPIVSNDQNIALATPPEVEEIKNAVHGMNPSSSPGPDGFTGNFYCHCWEIIKEDLIDAVRGFFKGHQIPKLFSAAHIIMLPKVKKACSFDQVTVMAI